MDEKVSIFSCILQLIGNDPGLTKAQLLQEVCVLAHEFDVHEFNALGEETLKAYHVQVV